MRNAWPLPAKGRIELVIFRNLTDLETEETYPQLIRSQDKRYCRATRVARAWEELLLRKIKDHFMGAVE